MKKNHELLQFELLLQFPELIHGMNTRLGGVSSGVYECLNMGWGLGDDEENVRQNYRIFAGALGFAPEKFTFSDQVHNAEIARITKEDCGNGFVFPKKEELKGMDGLITNQKGVALTIFSADCVPLLFYDAKKQVIGAAHSGWRGTVKGIAGQMVDILAAEYGCNPADIYVGIGPCISKESFEVGEDVKKEFEKVGKCDILNKIFQDKGNGKYLLDLRTYIQDSMLQKGILPEHIEVSQECTFQQEDLFFSHRRNGLQRGSHVNCIYMKEDCESDR